MATYEREQADFLLRRVASAGDAEVPTRRMGPRRWMRELGWRYLVAAIALGFALFPVVFVLASSFNTVDTLTTARIIPESLTLENYKALFEGCGWDLGLPPFTCESTTPFLNWLWNSIKIALIATTIQLAFSTLAAYSFARLRWPGRRTGLIAILLIQVFPVFLAFVAIFLLLDTLGNTFSDPLKVSLWLVMIGIFFAAAIGLVIGLLGDYSERSKRRALLVSIGILAVAFIWFILAPLIAVWIFDTSYQVSLFPAIGLGTHTGLIMVYLGGAVGVNTWLIKGFMDSIPVSLDEAAKVDGASEWFIFARIILPLSKPILVVIFVISFIAVYNEFILASVLIRDVEQFTYATGLALFVESEYAAKWGELSAAAVMGTVPILILFFVLQDRIVSGLQGAVKG